MFFDQIIVYFDFEIKKNEISLFFGKRCFWRWFQNIFYVKNMQNSSGILSPCSQEHPENISTFFYFLKFVGWGKGWCIIIFFFSATEPKTPKNGNRPTSGPFYPKKKYGFEKKKYRFFFFQKNFPIWKQRNFNFIVLHWKNTSY